MVRLYMSCSVSLKLRRVHAGDLKRPSGGTAATSETTPNILMRVNNDFKAMSMRILKEVDNISDVFFVVLAPTRN